LNGAFGLNRPADAATQHIGTNAACTTSFRIPRAFPRRKQPLGDAIMGDAARPEEFGKRDVPDFARYRHISTVNFSNLKQR
jgi:hypothetical protein